MRIIQRPTKTIIRSIRANLFHHRRLILLSIIFVLPLILHVKKKKTPRDNDPFATSLPCDPNGTCHEQPDKPSPRTVYSVKSKQQYEQWWSAHAALNQSATDFVSRRRKEDNKSSDPPFVLLGDSITETWLGADMGIKTPRGTGVPEVLEEYLSSFEKKKIKLDPLVLAIGGDQTQHLLWRLQHGQLLPHYANDEKAIFVLLIGTNNLGAGMLPSRTVSGIVAVAEYLLSNTKGYVMVLKLLPRANKQIDWMPDVTKVNDAIENTMIPKWKQTYGNSRVGTVDCGEHFLIGGGGVNKSLMPDLLHPNVDGHKILAECMFTHIQNNIVM